MVDDNRDSKCQDNCLNLLIIFVSVSVWVVEDFDFDFIDSTIKSSAEEMRGSLAACVEEIKSNAQEAELIDGAQDLTTQLNGQVAAVIAI